MATPNNTEWLTIEEAAALLGVSADRAYELLRWRSSVKKLYGGQRQKMLYGAEGVKMVAEERANEPPLQRTDPHHPFKRFRVNDPRSAAEQYRDRRPEHVEDAKRVEFRPTEQDNLRIKVLMELERTNRTEVIRRALTHYCATRMAEEGQDTVLTLGVTGEGCRAKRM